jgi:hypothetical protein
MSGWVGGHNLNTLHHIADAGKMVTQQGRTVMSEQEAILRMSQYKSLVEARLTRLEIHNQNILDDIKEIKLSIRWLIGAVFGLNTTIIGILTKGFGIF